MASAALDLLDQVVAEMGGVVREGQRQMVAEVEEALHKGSHLLVQAGTGTGKSLGYLTPLMTHCLATGERAIVSTATLGLQRQILTQDVPQVLQVLAEEAPTIPRVALLKGWNNYVCQFKLGGGYPQDTLFADPSDFSDSDSSDSLTALGAEVQRVRAWAEETETGDRDDLVPGVSERAWRAVSVSKRDCLGRNCPMVEDCFAMQARENCQKAQIVVTNHALLGIHAVGKSTVLPEFDCIVVDEAHELESIARSQATVSTSGNSLKSVAESIRRNGKTGTDDLVAAGRALDQEMRKMPEGLIRGSGPEAFEEALRIAMAATLDVMKHLERLSSDSAGHGLTLAKNMAGQLAEELSVLLAHDESVARWVSRDRDSNPHLSAAPLQVSRMLASSLWAEHTTILTSATLDIGGDFLVMARQTGIEWSDKLWRGVDVGSPFDYPKQGIIYVAEHLPPPGREGPTEQALQELVDLAEAARGGVLALYSSRKGAELAAERLRSDTDLTVYCQGDDVLPTLINQFKEDEDSCLVGTLSLWQGVDVPGDSCRLVVIDRIPFPRPDDPLVKARSEAVSRNGGNAFMQISLSQAALLMAQGAGRLLRRATDRGVVAILDPRVRTKQYGSFIMSSLPKMWRTVDPVVVRAALERLNQQ
ncbi:ATP-dependent DNA helicase [Boudabousia marimammalium]|uniref:ATP-dependent helicase DinG n=1 Tax=Boudabousia marimammalium TaxID=156892 RepID=A0A1Q5PNU5_9ACTO|nr:ATP-dependent DNA helicase [Boudabousia marimammalium]OKL49258.1 hypothetical protein BM477_04525 [Boudabousia marimammalium]